MFRQSLNSVTTPFVSDSNASAIKVETVPFFRILAMIRATGLDQDTYFTFLRRP